MILVLLPTPDGEQMAHVPLVWAYMENKSFRIVQFHYDTFTTFDEQKLPEYKTHCLYLWTHKKTLDKPSAIIWKQKQNIDWNDNEIIKIG